MPRVSLGGFARPGDARPRLPSAALAHGVERPAVRDPLELVLAAVGEGQLAADHEVADGARNEHLSRAGDAHDSRGEVDGKSGDVVAAALDFTGVQAAA